ncbi:hypothetical protein [Chryseobacterium indoltheticum]|uniref:hypothetical protein n=1 Tax=Chryseobacterium indoltheticum TaxID=254 RepID=UPI003F499D99
MIQIQKMLFENNIPSINMNYRLVSKHFTYRDQLEDINSVIEKFNALSRKSRTFTKQLYSFWEKVQEVI